MDAFTNGLVLSALICFWIGEAEKVVRVPFGGNTYTNTTDTVTISLNDYINTPVTMPEVILNDEVEEF